jgi:PAS domain-containing protein
MNASDLDDWTGQLNRAITSLQNQSAGEPLDRQETLAVLDTGFAELRAATEEVREQSARLEAVIRDATRVRLRHAALVSLVGGVVETDEWGVILEISPEVTRLLGIRPEAATGRPLLAFVAAHYYRGMMDCLHAIRSVPCRGKVIDLQARSGSPVQTVVSAVLVEFPDDDPARILWFIRERAARAGDPPTGTKF